MGGAIRLCRSVGPAVEQSTRVLSPQSSDDHCQTGEKGGGLDGTLWLDASCKLQYYANEGCKTCASLAGLLLTFIVVVTGSLAWLSISGPLTIGSDDNVRQVLEVSLALKWPPVSAYAVLQCLYE